MLMLQKVIHMRWQFVFPKPIWKLINGTSTYFYATFKWHLYFYHHQIFLKLRFSYYLGNYRFWYTLQELNIILYILQFSLPIIESSVDGDVLHCSVRRPITSHNNNIFDLTKPWYLLIAHGPIRNRRGKVSLTDLFTYMNSQ